MNTFNSDSSATKRLPPHFGEIDPEAPWDSKRFFTALAATGNTPYVFYAIDRDRVQIHKDICVPKTKLQKRRLTNLLAWERNKDPEHQQQFGYVKTLARSLPFGTRKEGEGPRYFYYPLA
jgi:hypothetical protein